MGEHGEQTGKLLSHKLRISSFSVKQITEIALDDGIDTCNQRQINSQFMQFYKHLYTCEMASDNTITQDLDELKTKGIERSD